MKLEPFQRGMRELAPKVWLTALRRVQNPNRAGLDIVTFDSNFGALKVSPFFTWTDAEMEQYLAKHRLPNEWDYFDPAKAGEGLAGMGQRWAGIRFRPLFALFLAFGEQAVAAAIDGFYILPLRGDFFKLRS